MIRRLVTLTAILVLTIGVGCKGGDKDKAKEGEQGNKSGEKPSEGERASEGDKVADEKTEPAKASSGKSNHEKLQGDWGVDIDAMMANDPKMAERARANPAMIEGMQKTLGAATISIGKDTVVARGFKPDQSKATYKVLSSDDDTMAIEIWDEGNDRLDRLTVTFNGDDKLTLTKEGKDEKMPLKRK
jgi:hypothetical protein